MARQQNTIDVSKLPTVVVSSRAPLWWGVVLMMVIEGIMIVILVASYFYLRQNEPHWPPAGTLPPDLTKGTIEMGILLVSLIPTYLVERYAQRNGSKKQVLLWLVVTALFCLAAVYFRAVEFTGLNCRWDTHAYGSVIWTTLGLHAFHLLSSTFETIIFLIYLLLYPLDRKHRLDAALNSVYWYFVVGAWILCYAVIYLSPLLVEKG